MRGLRTLRATATFAALAVVVPLLIPNSPPSTVNTDCGSVDQSAGWVVRENTKEGDADWHKGVVTGWVGDGKPYPLRYARNTVAVSNKNPKKPRSAGIVGWFDKVSAACGDSVGLHLSGRNKAATVTLYRLGYYGGLGARKVWEHRLTVVARQSATNVSPAPERTVTAKWSTSLVIPIGSEFPPGEYLARLDDGGAASFAPLLIKAESSRSPLLFISSVLTWQAYNHFGGFSLYTGDSRDRATRSRVVSFDRPYDSSGAGQVLIHEYGVIKTSEKLGLDMTYLTDIDIDAKPALLKQHTSIVFGGHGEYWTHAMRAGITAARDSGINLIVLGANTGFWKTRLQNNGREVAVWRDPLDPFLFDPLKVTNKWREGPVAQPESEILGASYVGLGVSANYEIVNASSWPIAGTSLKTKQLIMGVVGREVDSPDNVPEPGLQIFLTAKTIVRKRLKVVGMTYYTNKSGAGVLNASTNGWVCAITNSCNWGRMPKKTSIAVVAITAQILKDATKGPLGELHPATIDIPANSR